MYGELALDKYNRLRLGQNGCHFPEKNSDQFIQWNIIHTDLLFSLGSKFQQTSIASDYDLMLNRQQANICATKGTFVMFCIGIQLKYQVNAI